MVSAMSYPPTFRTAMKNIKITTGSTNPNVAWQIYNRVTDCGQHTDEVSNSSVNGEVDLCYGVSGFPSVSAVSWYYDRLDIFGLGTDDAFYHKHGPAMRGLRVPLDGSISVVVAIVHRSQSHGVRGVLTSLYWEPTTACTTSIGRMDGDLQPPHGSGLVGFSTVHLLCARGVRTASTSSALELITRCNLTTKHGTAGGIRP